MGRERPRRPAPRAAPAPPTGSLTPHWPVQWSERALVESEMRSVSDSRPELARVVRTLLPALCGDERLTASRKSRRCFPGRSTLRLPLFGSASRASRLPSVPSALRGLDPRLALPMVWPISERRSHCRRCRDLAPREGRSQCRSTVRSGGNHRLIHGGSHPAILRLSPVRQGSVAAQAR